MSFELDKEYIMEIIATRLQDYKEKDEKEIDESKVRTLYRFIYEITVYNIKTIQFILDNESIKTHKTNK